MVNTRTSKRKSPPPNANDAKASAKRKSPPSNRNDAKASAKRSQRDVSDDEAAVSSDHPLILIPPRDDDFNAKTWWMVDLAPVEETSLQGASALVKRCMRTYSWGEAKARKVLAAYRQFIVLKKELEDWNAEILSPCHLVDQMWHCHILDVVNYCHDMMLLCGHVVGHNPDGALDYAAKRERDETTRASLQDHFGSFDEEVWNYSPDSADRNVGNNAMKPEDASNNDQGITLRLRGLNGEETMFKVGRRAKMGKVFNAYASKKGVHAHQIRFLLYGERIDSEATPASLNLDDGDQIDCFLQTIAC